MIPPLPRGVFYLLAFLGLSVCALFAFAMWFFPAHSIERLIVYFVLTIGVFVLMSATGLALTQRWLERRFGASPPISAATVRNDADSRTPPPKRAKIAHVTQCAASTTK